MKVTRSFAAIVALLILVIPASANDWILHGFSVKGGLVCRVNRLDPNTGRDRLLRWIELRPKLLDGTITDGELVVAERLANGFCWIFGESGFPIALQPLGDLYFGQFKSGFAFVLTREGFSLKP